MISYKKRRNTFSERVNEILSWDNLLYTYDIWRITK